MAQREMRGAAEALTLEEGINSIAVSFVASTTPSSGWPTGNPGPFVVRLDGGSANEEKMLVTTRSGATFTNVTRGYDGTTAVSHTAGATIEHVLDADTIQEANSHVNNTSRDDHTQYLNTTRHDVTARHTFGAAFASPSAPPNIAASGGAGSAAGPARSDHTHGVPNDLITFAMMQNIATDRLIGRDTSGTGDPELLTVGGGLEFTGSGGITIADGGYVASTYTPTLTASGSNPTLGSGSSANGEYTQVGKLVVCWGNLGFGSSGVNAGSGTYFLNAPTSMATSQPFRRCGVALLFDSSATAFAQPIVIQDGTNQRFKLSYPATWPAGSATDVTSTSPWTWSALDAIQFFAVYLPG